VEESTAAIFFFLHSAHALQANVYAIRALQYVFAHAGEWGVAGGVVWCGGLYLCPHEVTTNDSVVHVIPCDED
jgi:hypothetical protein